MFITINCDDGSILLNLNNISSVTLSSDKTNIEVRMVTGEVHKFISSSEEGLDIQENINYITSLELEDIKYRISVNKERYMENDQKS